MLNLRYVNQKFLQAFLQSVMMVSSFAKRFTNKKDAHVWLIPAAAARELLEQWLHVKDCIDPTARCIMALGSSIKSYTSLEEKPRAHFRIAERRNFRLEVATKRFIKGSLSPLIAVDSLFVRESSHRWIHREVIFADRIHSIFPS